MSNIIEIVIVLALGGLIVVGALAAVLWWVMWMQDEDQ